jgi:hypothetical protein
MWAYPIDAFRIWWILRPYERIPPPATSSATGGYLLDVQLGITHAGPMGWLGALACVFGLGWLVVAGTMWVRSRVASKRLDRASRMVLLAVIGSVLAVLVSHYLLWRVFGILVS